MIVTSLEFKFDERRRAAAAVEDIPKMFCGEIARSVADFGVELVFGAEDCAALGASKDRTFCLIFGHDDALIFAMRAPKYEFDVHASSNTNQIGNALTLNPSGQAGI